MAHHRHAFAPWFFIALILSNHGIAMAARIEAKNNEEVLAAGPGQHLEKAHDTYQEMSCESLALNMERVTGEAVAWLAEIPTFAEMNTQQIQSLSKLVIQMGAIADVADMKLCLSEVMNSGEVDANLENFRSAEERFLTAATSDAARERFTRAFSRMADIVSGIGSLRGEILNRHVLLPDNIEDPAVCPSPCNSCTKEHNSWFHDAEVFSFKCIMDAGTPKPKGEGFTCDEPVSRRSNSREQKSWCEVHHWQAAAQQTTEIGAKTACGARSIMTPLQNGNDMSDLAVAACEGEMTGEALTQEQINELRRLDNEMDEVVSPGNFAAFSLFMMVTLLTAVSELRLRTRTPSSLIEAEQSEEADQPVTIHPIDYTSGSWKCRRGILSLAKGLFGAMIEIIIGVTYLAIAGSLGLLAAMSMFGADAVVASLAGLVGSSVTTIGEVLNSATGAVTRRIGNFLANRQVVQQSAAAAGEAGAIAAGGQAAAGAAAVDAAAIAETIAAQEAQALATTIETLGGHGEEIMKYWPAVAAGLTLFSVGFGIWGLGRIWHSFDSPFDCKSGYARVGGKAVCHPAMKFGEAHHAECPGFEKPANATAPPAELAFVCAESNGGITAFNSGGCHPDRR